MQHAPNTCIFRHSSGARLALLATLLLTQDTPLSLSEQLATAVTPLSAAQWITPVEVSVQDALYLQSIVGMALHTEPA